MDTISLCRLSCSDNLLKTHFGVVYASDTLLKKKTSYKFFIVNLDPKILPGSHWIAIHLNGKSGYYFDSYGMPPRNKRILSFMKRNCNSIKYNSECFQDYQLTTCGYFCFYFLYRSARNKPLDNLRVKDKRYNERFIKMFVRKKNSFGMLSKVWVNKKTNMCRNYKYDIPLTISTVSSAAVAQNNYKKWSASAFSFANLITKI